MHFSVLELKSEAKLLFPQKVLNSGFKKVSILGKFYFWKVAILGKLLFWESCYFWEVSIFGKCPFLESVYFGKVCYFEKRDRDAMYTNQSSHHEG